MAEALRVTSPVHSLEDIVVPMSEIPETVAEIQVIADRHHIKIACFGHAGDGNIHATLLKEGLTDTEWPMVRDQVLAEIYEKAYARGGTLSGEHGVGAKRKEALARFIDPTKLNLMRAIKKSFDPNLILNPGKVFEISNLKSAGKTDFAGSCQPAARFCKPVCPPGYRVMRRKILAGDYLQ